MKIGIFFNGDLMVSYDTDESEQAFEDFKYFIEETGLFHELKLYQE